MKSMIVDDELMSRMMLTAIIGLHGECKQAASGAEAVAYFSEALDAGSPYDLVCLDLEMPGMNGLEALGRIRETVRARGACPPFKVFIMTGGNHADDLDQGLLGGEFDRYFLKPYNREVILRTLDEYGLR